MIRSLPSNPPDSPDVLHSSPRQSFSLRSFSVSDVLPTSSSQTPNNSKQEEFPQDPELPRGPGQEWVRPNPRGLLRPNPRNNGRQIKTALLTSQEI